MRASRTHLTTPPPPRALPPRRKRFARRRGTASTAAARIGGARFSPIWAEPSQSPSRPAAPRGPIADGATLAAVLDPVPRTEAALEPLDDYLVIEPLDETETATGLIVPVNEAAQCRTGIVAAVGPDVTGVDPGDKVLYPRDAGYEVRLARSSHRV